MGLGLEVTREFASLEQLCAMEAPAFCSLFSDLNGTMAKIFLTDKERAVCMVARDPSLCRTPGPMPSPPAMPPFIGPSQTQTDVEAQQRQAYEDYQQRLREFFTKEDIASEEARKKGADDRTLQYVLIGAGVLAAVAIFRR